MQFQRDPIGGGVITYEVVQLGQASFRLRRTCDNGGNASTYDVRSNERELLDFIAATCAAAEGGEVVEP